MEQKELDRIKKAVGCPRPNEVCSILGIDASGLAKALGLPEERVVNWMWRGEQPTIEESIKMKELIHIHNQDFNMPLVIRDLELEREDLIEMFDITERGANDLKIGVRSPNFLEKLELVRLLESKVKGEVLRKVMKELEGEKKAGGERSIPNFLWPSEDEE